MNSNSILPKFLDAENEKIYEEIKAAFFPSLEKKTELTQAEQEKLLKSISQFKEQRLFELTEKDPELKKFFSSDTFFNKALSENDRYPGHLPKQTFVTIDQKETYSPFRLLMGEFLLGEYEQMGEEDKTNHSPKKLELLNKACEEGSFYALQERMKLNIQKIAVMEKVEKNEVLKYLLSIMTDGSQMGNLYRSLGFWQAANMMLDTTKEFFKLPGVKIIVERHNVAVAGFSRKRDEKLEKVDDIVIMLESILEKAMEFYALAFLTSGFPSSKFFNEVFNNGRDWLQEFSDIFYDMDSGKRFLTTAIREVYEVRSPRFFDQGIAKAQALIKQHAHDQEYKLGS